MKIKQTQRILEILKAGGSITDNEARDNLGIERLGARICELRNAGVPIGDKWEHGTNRYGDDTKWKRYFLVFGGEYEVPNNNTNYIAESE